jgi:hypothetical protein
MRIRRHAQNLHQRVGDGFKGAFKGPLWRYGRGWLNVVDDEKDEDIVSFSVNWHLGKEVTSTRLGLTFLTEGDDVLLSFGLPRLFSLYLGTKFLGWERIKKLGLSDIAATGHGFDALAFSIMHEGLGTWVSLRLWSQEHYDSSMEKRKWSFFPFEKLTGGMVYDVDNNETLVDKKVTIYLPEGEYELRVRLIRQRREWRKLPLPADEHIYSKVDVIGPIKLIDGNKGLRGQSCSEDSVNGAVAEFMKSILKDRGGDFEWNVKLPGQGIKAMGKAIRVANEAG